MLTLVAPRESLPVSSKRVRSLKNGTYRVLQRTSFFDHLGTEGFLPTHSSSLGEQLREAKSKPGAASPHSLLEFACGKFACALPKAMPLFDDRKSQGCLALDLIHPDIVRVAEDRP